MPIYSHYSSHLLWNSIVECYTKQFMSNETLFQQQANVENFSGIARVTWNRIFPPIYSGRLFTPQQTPSTSQDSSLFLFWQVRHCTDSSLCTWYVYDACYASARWPLLTSTSEQNKSGDYRASLTSGIFLPKCKVSELLGLAIVVIVIISIT